MKDLYWGLLLFVLLVVVLVNPFKVKLREYHGGRGCSCGGGGGRGCSCGGGGGRGCSCGGGRGYGYYGYDEDYYHVLPKYFPFPLGYS